MRTLEELKLTINEIDRVRYYAWLRIQKSPNCYYPPDVYPFEVENFYSQMETLDTARDLLISITKKITHDFQLNDYLVTLQIKKYSLQNKADNSALSFQDEIIKNNLMILTYRYALGQVDTILSYAPNFEEVEIDLF